MGTLRDLLITVGVLIGLGSALIILPVVGGILAVLATGLVVYAVVRDSRITAKQNKEMAIESEETSDG